MAYWLTIMLTILCTQPVTCTTTAQTTEGHCSRNNDKIPTTALITFNASLPMMQFTIDGTNFHSELLHLDAKQIQELREEALLYFTETFGISAQTHQKDVALRLYEVNPMVKMRCVYLSSESYIPVGGYTVRDGGLMMTVINPNGIKLGGKYPGMHAEFGTTFSLGHWVIQREDKSCNKISPLVWKNKHVAPGGIATYDQGSRSFHGIMEVYSEEFGKGEALHVTKYSVDSRGKATAQFRNTVTFS